MSTESEGFVKLTRTQRADRLLERLEHGPQGHLWDTNDEARQALHRWLDTWITPAVIDLIPELKPYRTK